MSVNADRSQVRRGRTGARVELELCFNGRPEVWDGERALVTTDAPADPAHLRTRRRSLIALPGAWSRCKFP